ncbi:MAG: hypothetical protein Q4G13_07645 [Moraxella sp.]|nr:hypothetical protein [Moraxella sp.]
MTDTPPKPSRRFGYLNAKIKQFIASRLPRSDSQTLSIHNVYVFFSSVGWLFLALLAITFISGVNYGNNLILGLFFYLLSIWLVAAVLTYLQVSPLAIHLQRTNLAQNHSLIWVDIELHNVKGKASRQIELYFEEDNDYEHLLNADDLTTYRTHRQLVLPVITERIHARLPIIAHKRGAITLPRLCIKSQYPLGVVRSWSYVYFASPAFAYPVPHEFDWQTTHKLTKSNDEQISNQYQAGQDDFDMLDDYVEGESLAKVSWAHVAKGAGMLTKRFADPIGKQWQLNYNDMPSSHHEDKLSELAHAVLAMHETGIAFEMVLPNDGSGGIGSGDEFIQASLLRLAKAP